MTIRLTAPCAALAALALTACSPQTQAEAAPRVEEAPATHPVSGLQVIPLTVRTDSEVHRFRVEVARTAEEQARGLMFRTELGPNEGMIFPNEPPQPRSFWMKNTPLPLDIIYIGPDRRIRNIAAKTTPYSTESVPSVGAVVNVLEIPGGRAAELGIEAGDSVEW
ncbi:DUF192 domain-containing protein [Qipengyuania sp. MTN3-11]|uniref:DUF192 domain-containing protein n=1 Tax=Qipengyuania sp. MTN3-11 TaxID=3056557 RepID=UPI0036F42543